MQKLASNQPQPPSEIGGYSVVRTLSLGRSYVAVAPGGRQVVLKMLDADCLLRGQLHPNIHDRLARVRELAHAGVANLHGVERAGGRAFMVWDFVEGQTLDQRAAAWESARDAALAARELLLTIESLHALGIVHGAIHGRNIIFDSRQRIVLTHVSALLYYDPADDVAATIATLAAVVRKRGWEDSPLGKAVIRAGGARGEGDRSASGAKIPSPARIAARGEPNGSAAANADRPATTLAQIRWQIASETEDNPAPRPAEPDCGVRRWTAAGAAAAAAAGILIAAAMLWFAWASTPRALSPPELPPAITR